MFTEKVYTYLVFKYISTIRFHLSLNQMKMLSEEKDLYKQGHNPTLVKRSSIYRKLSVFSGNAVDVALSDKEGTLMVDLWIKERTVPWKMRTQEVLTLVELSERITAWRKSRRREKTRIRNERLRKKLRNAADNHDKAAVKKLKQIKKAAALNSKTYRKKKREEKKSK